MPWSEPASLGGILEEVLERIATLLERDRAIRKRVVAALAYPASVACAAGALVIFLLTTIVPMFRGMYAEMRVPLPPITAALIEAGTALSSPAVWICTAVCSLAAVAAFATMRNDRRGSAAIEAVTLSLPFAGAIAKKANVARLARTLGTLLRSGVGLVEALGVVGGGLGSAALRRSMAELRDALGEGSSVSEPLAQSGLYEPMFVQMIRVGEETGELDAMLLRVADYYDLDVETLLSALGSLLEPAMIVLLGGAVGFIVAAIFIPLYTLIGNMK